MITHFFYKKLPKDTVEIRTSVFVDEQGFTEEFDQLDKQAVHVVIFFDGIPAATGRVFIEDGIYYIGRVAVQKQFRGQHLGAEVLYLLEKWVKEDGGSCVHLFAQCHAQGFYEKCGYLMNGETHMEEYCPHVGMTKKI